MNTFGCFANISVFSLVWYLFWEQLPEFGEMYQIDWEKPVSVTAWLRKRGVRTQVQKNYNLLQKWNKHKAKKNTRGENTINTNETTKPERVEGHRERETLDKTTIQDCK